MTIGMEGTGTTGQADDGAFEKTAVCDITTLAFQPHGIVRVVVSAQSEVIRATVDPLAAERKARIKAFNAAIKAGYLEPTVSTR